MEIDCILLTRLYLRFFPDSAWEFESAPRQVALADADWENPNMVSVIIMRDPISRLLAKDGYMNHYFPGLMKASNRSTSEGRRMWRSYANYDRNTNNYALRILAGNGCCRGERTDRKHIDAARSLLRRFTFVLDIDCLDDGMSELARILEIPINERKLERKKSRRKKYKPNHERIPYRDIYDYLVRKNKLDIELYEWSKSLSLVNCSALPTS